MAYQIYFPRSHDAPATSIRVVEEDDDLSPDADDEEEDEELVASAKAAGYQATGNPRYDTFVQSWRASVLSFLVAIAFLVFVVSRFANRRRTIAKALADGLLRARFAALVRSGGSPTPNLICCHPTLIQPKVLRNGAKSGFPACSQTHHTDKMPAPISPHLTCPTSTWC